MTATLLLHIAGKTTLVFIAGWALTALMGRASAASRHLVWVLTLAGVLAAPVVHLVGPSWTLSVLPSSPPVAAEAVPHPLVPPGPVSSFEPSDDERRSAREAQDAGPGSADAPAVGIGHRLSAWVRVNWLTLFVGIWLGGAVLLGLRLLIGVMWATVLVRRGDEVMDTRWLDALEDASAAMGVTRAVELRVSEAVRVPMATGLWRAVILLPPLAMEWAHERRTVVLQHELAHVRRWDCLLQALAQSVCALHWFNPLAHLAVARVRAEQERACDDIVLQRGTDPHSYADQLLEIARSFRAEPFPSWVAMSMARPSQLEERMLAILDTARARCAPTLATSAALTTAMVLVAMPLGALRLSASPVVSAASFATDEGRPSQPTSVDSQPIALQQTSAPALAGVVRTAAFEMVRGQTTDLELLGSTALTAVDDVVLAGRLVELPAVFMSARLGKNATTPGGVAAQAQDGAQAQTAVSDETRRRVADALMSALADDNAEVRNEALTALASMRDERAVPGLVRAVSDATPEVRMRAVSALAQFNTPAAADGLVTALKDRNNDVRRQAAQSLASLIGRGQLRDQKYIDALTTLVRDDDASVRRQAVGMLGRLRRPTAVAPLTQALRDSSPQVREQAVRGLGETGSPEAVPALLPMLKDPSADVREQAARALGALADPRAIDSLTVALKDASPGVREEAARALGQVARGERRRVRPVAPTPPIPPLRPRAMAVDEDRWRAIAERAQAAAERAQREVEDRMRDFDLRLDRFDVPFARPVPAPAPARAVPPPPPARPADPR